VNPLQGSFLAGAAAMMIAGTAHAQSPNTHVLTIQLSGGGVARIQYTGDTPPQVFVDANPARADSFWVFPGFGPDSPFAASTGCRRSLTGAPRGCWSKPKP
jgi:hypothetical protein